MPRRGLSNRIQPAELCELVQRSGLTRGTFARILGLPRTTLGDMMAGRSPPTRVVLNAARFVMLQLGHTVEIVPIKDIKIHRAVR